MTTALYLKFPNGEAYHNSQRFDHTDGVAITKAEYTRARKERAKARLREVFPKGSAAYTIVNHVSSSGMTRSIKVIGSQNNEPVDMSWAVADAIGWSFDNKRGGVKVSGCGMDMAFHLVSTMSYAVHDGDSSAVSKRSL